jgi:hypothetical protein
MGIEMLTYAQLGERLNCSREAARALARRLRLPRQKANDGKVLVSVDLAEINHTPKPRSPVGHRPITGALQAIEGLQGRLANLEGSVARNRADLDRERERWDQLIVEHLRTTLDAQRAKEAVARLEAALEAQRTRVWWRRLTSWPRVLGARGVPSDEKGAALPAGLPTSAPLRQVAAPISPAGQSGAAIQEAA